MPGSPPPESGQVGMERSSVHKAQTALITALTNENAQLRMDLSEARDEVSGLQLQLARANVLVELYSNPQASAAEAAHRINELPAEQVAPKARRARHCTCCGQSHADARTCGRSHVCLKGICQAN